MQGRVFFEPTSFETPNLSKKNLGFSALEGYVVLSCRTSSCRTLAGFCRMSLRLWTILVCGRILNRLKKLAKDVSLTEFRGRGCVLRPKMFASVNEQRLTWVFSQAFWITAQFVARGWGGKMCVVFIRTAVMLWTTSSLLSINHLMSCALEFNTSTTTCVFQISREWLYTYAAWFFAWALEKKISG